jgi:hypothetical protein
LAKSIEIDQIVIPPRVGSSYFGIAYRRKEEGMASTIHRQRRISSRARFFSGVLGAGLFGLLLAAPLSWSQTTDVTILQVNIIAPESGQVIDSDCFRLDHITGNFTSDRLSTQGASNGVWYAYDQLDLPSLFTAHVNLPPTAGQAGPNTVSYGGVLDLIGGMGAGAIVQSDGTPLAYEAQVNPKYPFRL